MKQIPQILIVYYNADLIVAVFAGVDCTGISDSTKCRGGRRGGDREGEG